MLAEITTFPENRKSSQHALKTMSAVSKWPCEPPKSQECPDRPHQRQSDRGILNIVLHLHQKTTFSIELQCLVLKNVTWRGE
jgi:hypothetical protein